MKLLAVPVLLCAMMALTAADVEETSGGAEGLIPPGEHDVNKTARCCPWGWTRYYDRCFLYVHRARTWARAQRNCRRRRANLVSVRNVHEYRQIQRLIFAATHRNRWAWIGGSRRRGCWNWIDGTRFSYSNWCAGQPNNCWGRQNCIQVNFSGRKCWRGQRCHYRLPFVCARRLW